MDCQLDMFSPAQPAERSVEDTATFGVTARDSKALPVHRWYRYVEGFSAQFIVSRLNVVRRSGGLVYDPFGGAGAVNVEARKAGIRSSFTELNPFMRWVTETKTNAATHARRRLAEVTKRTKDFSSYLRSKSFERQAANVNLSGYASAFPGRPIFEEQNLRLLLSAKAYVDSLSVDTHVRSLLTIAIAGTLVDCSNMTRRADLRYRREGEYKDRIVDVASAITSRLGDIVSDLHFPWLETEDVAFVNNNARALHAEAVNAIDNIITSPPYLNGTNYFRNTKIELWFFDYIKTERELPLFNLDCVAGGITSVTKARRSVYTNPQIEKIVRDLRATEGDGRIATMVEMYFSDMFEVLRNCLLYLKSGGTMSLDIGDSKFYGVHVPTDLILANVARDVGFAIQRRAIIARRHSRDKTPLSQVELTLRRP